MAPPTRQRPAHRRGLGGHGPPQGRHGWDGTFDQLQVLDQATGRDVDDRFLRLMIVHVAGGVAVADEILTRDNASAVRELAALILKAQGSEITQMQSTRRRLGLPPAESGVPERPLRAQPPAHTGHKTTDPNGWPPDSVCVAAMFGRRLSQAGHTDRAAGVSGQAGFALELERGVCHREPLGDHLLDLLADGLCLLQCRMTGQHKVGREGADLSRQAPHVEIVDVPATAVTTRVKSSRLGSFGVDSSTTSVAGRGRLPGEE